MSVISRITDGIDILTITDVEGKKAADVNVVSLTLTDADDAIAIGDGSGKKALFTEWVVYLPSQKTIVFTNEAFQQSFTEVV